MKRSDQALDSGDAGRPAMAARSRPLRADARRNRLRVLDAADQAFAAEGIAVPLEEIARLAGVGAGTVHRHFPTKESLFEAVYTRRVEQLAAQARSLAQHGGSDEAFFDFLAQMIDEGVGKRILMDAMGSVEISESATPMGDDLAEAIGELLVQSQKRDQVRDDVSVTDVMALVAGLIAGTRRHRDSPGLAERIFTVVRDGLRPQTGDRPRLSEGHGEGSHQGQSRVSRDGR